VHNREESRGIQKTNLLTVLLMTGSFMVIEVVAGLLTGTPAFPADAGHMLTDVAKLGT